MMKAVLCFGLLAILIGCVRGWGRILSGENSIGYNSWIPARRSWRGLYRHGGWRTAPAKCGGNRDLCWQNSQCCKGYYCATVDDGSIGECETYALNKGSRIGDVCEDNSDCSIADGLCCQYVQVFRRKPKKMCHQISGLNKCIKSTSFGNNIIKK
ncbi:ITG-like peptide isoform X3 [Lineus longissimus]|uniref:ITG-like peptide isoform X3 n=1 Tax=Lineus longissimus TaxID=88925 RepID=UPI002B4F851A